MIATGISWRSAAERSVSPNSSSPRMRVSVPSANLVSEPAGGTPGLSGAAGCCEELPGSGRQLVIVPVALVPPKEPSRARCER
jgi:hypothetical protein